MQINLDNVAADDFLGRAAIKRNEAAIALKAEKYDLAWQLQHEVKSLYAQHCNKLNSLIGTTFGVDEIIRLDSSVSEDLALILMKQGKYTKALSHLVYCYLGKGEYAGVTINKKLKAYFNRAYKGKDFERFKKLIAPMTADFVLNRDFVENIYPTLND